MSASASPENKKKKVTMWWKIIDLKVEHHITRQNSTITFYSSGKDMLMSGDVLWSEYSSEPFQVAASSVASRFCLSLETLTDSLWVWSGIWDMVIKKFSPSAFACEIGLANVTVSGTADVGETTVCCSRWYFFFWLFCAFCVKLPTTICNHYKKNSNRNM